ncbi:helicase-associated domain-containing protein [Prauserella muralis]|uniref:helicase-associated domain-containing protein n=1 Tax=Prauserella muralis TaxID=588067 RepID=UPI000DD2F687|nr:helicase-associated domain-containing protein [Prauserella muralis]
MVSGSFAEYLAGLDETRLARLLRLRPDVRIEPVPRGFGQLAERLGGAESLAFALRQLTRDGVRTGQAVAALGGEATVRKVARLLGAPEPVVADLVTDLCERGLAWLDGETVRLPDRLAAHWSAEVGDGRPVADVARSVRVEDLRVAAAALGAEAEGLRKPELIARLADALADTPAVARVVAGLPRPARDCLDVLSHGSPGAFWSLPAPRPAGPQRLLAAAGLALNVNGRWEVPREVAVAAWLAEFEPPVLTGPLDLPSAAMSPAEMLATAQAAAQDVLRAVTSVLDTARSKPLAALKKGGVGARERTRLAARLALPAETVLLAIDVAHAAGLLGHTDAGYAPTEAFSRWREEEPSRQWAELATAWFGMEHAPTSREQDDGKEVPPPLPLASGAGMIRRALVRAAAGGRSFDAAGRQLDWFCPLHGYEPDEVGQKVEAVVREGHLLGVLAGDVVTDCGERLAAVADESADDPVAELADRVASLLPEAPCTVVLQSDLTAVVSGQLTVRASRLLGAAAVCETRGTASIWRFTPETVRHALDTGWNAESLRQELAVLSDRPLPQPLDYLIADVSRRHGQVRVRGLRSCVLADEATVTEILHTRRLGKLHLARLAPTVLSSPYELDNVLAALRAAGFAPVAEDAEGAVIIEENAEHEAAASRRAGPGATRDRVSATNLAARLLADPEGETVSDGGPGETFEQLAELNPRLSAAELALLADALDQERDVAIVYRDKNGTRTRRAIQPRVLFGRWLESWCYLRNGDRDFTVANIESVAPA